MKYIIVVGDGMADLPLKELGGLTPLQYAHKPATNRLAANGINGLVYTVPHGMVPESDTANLALMGYDPRLYSKGRSPLEAASMGLHMDEHDTAIRANLASLSEGNCDYNDRLLLDHSSDEITTEEADILIKYLQENLCGEGFMLHTGISYRHCMICKDLSEYSDFTRPHDIIGKRIGDYLPTSSAGKMLWEMQRRSFDLLSSHPLNISRAERGLKKANTLWFWSPGKKPMLPDFRSKYGLNATVICAVDLIKGIGVCAGMSVPNVKGATGAPDTDYSAKMQAALEALQGGADFVYIHVEAPDECGHHGDAEGKIKSIESIDKYIVAPLTEALDNDGIEYRIAITPDHPTPVHVRSHTHGAVPFLIYDSRKSVCDGVSAYSEQGGADGKIYLEKGEQLLPMLLEK